MHCGWEQYAIYVGSPLAGVDVVSARKGRNSLITLGGGYEIAQWSYLGRMSIVCVVPLTNLAQWFMVHIASIFVYCVCWRSIAVKVRCLNSL